ncbi:GNAT family N-acetyltransferase [Chloroflexota bacterium]
MALARLIPQGWDSRPSATKAQLEEIVSSPAVVLFVAKESSRDSEIVGTFTLVMFRIPTGMRALLHNLVVDSKSRRKGIAEALTRAALQRAAKAGVQTIELTSKPRPSREVAVRMYKQMGFTQNETNVYRYDFES